jgi:putative protease
MVTQRVELLAPAGSPEALDAAAAEGADGVYLGLKTFNARMRSANFAYSQFEGALRSLHRMGRKIYVTVNTVFEQREADRVYQLLKYLAGIGPDGVIVQDFGVLTMAREFPALKLHASTQMNIASAWGANALSRYGVSRVVLARELTLGEIRNIHQGTNLELEVFVHGALCVSASGLCLFSSYLGGKSANRGLCTQACRRLYTTEGAGKNNSEPDAVSKGYFFSPCDLSLIARIPELAEAGVKSFKIEGRMKSAEYVGTVVSAYRRVIDSLEAGEDQQLRALEDARHILQNDFARSKTEFFAGFETTVSDGTADTYAAPDWFKPDQDGGTGISLGTILKVKGAGMERRALIKAPCFDGLASGKISSGDSVRFHKADDSLRQAHKLIHAESNGRDGYLISIPEGFDIGDSVYLIQTRAMTKRYPPVIPRDLGPFRRQPGREKAPPAALPETTQLARQNRGRAQKNGAPTIPEGLFAAFASTDDLYIAQSLRPAAVILPVNQTTAHTLVEDKTLPFKPEEIILTLDPYFPQADDAFLAGALKKLEERGYRRFILNNPGHFSFFQKNKNVRPQAYAKEPAASAPLLIAGPWLYTFNAWAAAFAASLGTAAFITPLENNRQNLEKTMPPRLRSSVFVTLFAWPPLFRVRGNLRNIYSFKEFKDSRGETFSLIGGRSAAPQDLPTGDTVIIPDTPFSIVDKRPFLMEAGFRRFILDFSGGTFTGSFPVKKKFYREIMAAAEEGQPLRGITRFNWKDGFFSEKN